MDSYSVGDEDRYRQTGLAEDIEVLGHETFLGLPKDIWLVIGIDLILISIRLKDRI